MFSQFEEDGVLHAIFATIGHESRFYVEIGTQTGHECNSRFWREQMGWKGCMYDDKNRNIHIGLQMVTVLPENVNTLLNLFEVPWEFDLLSIDIDVGSVILWGAVDPRYRPRVVVVEPNEPELV